jgi:hypothetical protein
LEATIQEIEKKMEESLKEMAIQTEQQLKGQKQDMEDLKVGNFGKIPLSTQN